MTYRLRLLSYLWIVALVACPAIANLATAEQGPNVLLILVDDLKPSFGAYGDDFVQSPNLDRLAASGMRFDAAYCNQAVCAPSRNNLLIGSRSTSTGIYSLGYHFRRALPDAVTLPQHFMNHGYHSAGIGKVFHIGHGNKNDEQSWSVPFQPDKVVDYVLPESTNGELTREEALFSNRKARGLPKGSAWEKADVDDEAYADGRIASESIRRLENYQKSGDPFFLAVGFTKPHLPFCAPSKYWDLYDPETLPVAPTDALPNAAPEFAGKVKLGEIAAYKPVPDVGPIPPRMAKKLVHGYYASMSYMDAQLGRVLQTLDSTGLAENTIVVLWGDHGYHLGDLGQWTKHTNYEQANRIPILVRAPGVTRQRSASSALIETVDIFPTVCELAGLPIPDGPQPIDGDSFVGVLRGQSSDQHDHAYHCYPRDGKAGRSIRTDRYRLVEWRKLPKDGKPAPDSVLPVTYELYDYVTDPNETKNLADDQPSVVKEMLTILARHPAAKPAK